MKNTDLFIQEEDYSDLRGDDAVRHLSEAIRCQTVGFVDVDKVDFSQFDRLHEVLRRSFPRIFEHAEVKTFRKSLLIRLEGSDPSLRPGMFIAHQDVVPIIPGTEKNWTYPPFSGEIAEGSIWGRGTLDIKEMLIAIMESAEYLLEHEASIRRTIYIAFGDDEETLNTGAQTMGQYLKSQGVELEFVLDESTANVTDAAVYGAPGKLIYPIGIYEKGYADLYLKVKSQGGHSSNPFYGTSLGILAQSIASILAHPFKPELPDCAMETLLSLKPYMTLEPLKSLMENPEGNKPAILDYFLSQKELYFQVQTTIAPTMITPGSQAGNVMPQDMEAVINYRLSPQDTTDSVLAHAREHIDERVEAGYVQCINASIPSETRSYGFRKLVSALEHSFKDLTFVPAINKGTTDAHNYECICRCCYRVSPFLEETEVAQKGIHGTDEHLSIRAYLQGIRTILRFMEETCVKVEE